MATVIIPTPLRKFTNNSTRIMVSAKNVSDVLLELGTNFPDLKRHLVDLDGNTAPFINIFIDNEDVRNLDQEQTDVTESTIISIVPAIAGGIHFPNS